MRLDENNTKAHVGRGQALCGDNNINESIEEYNKALEIEPENKNAMISKANSLMKNNQIDEALELYKKGIEIDDGTDNCIHLINYALCLSNKKEVEFSELSNILERAEKSYESQKDKLTQKEKQFFEENLDKLKKEREK